MSRLGFTNLLQFILLVTVQVLIARNLPLYDVAFCYVYIGFLLFLPIQLPVVLQLIIGLVTGLTVDIFYDTLGIHAAACVLLCYVRPGVLRLLTPRDGYDSSDTPNVHRMGYYWFLPYVLTLIFVHHTALFFLEVFGIEHWWLTLLRVVLSTVYTFLSIMIVQFLFFPIRNSRK